MIYKESERQSSALRGEKYRGGMGNSNRELTGHRKGIEIMVYAESERR